MAERWVQGIIGIWVLLAPWLLGFAEVSLAKWSSVLCGLALILMSAWAIFGQVPPGDRSRKGQ